MLYCESMRKELAATFGITLKSGDTAEAESRATRNQTGQCARCEADLDHNLVQQQRPRRPTMTIAIVAGSL